MIVTKPNQIVLISGSPRRRELLEIYGYDVDALLPRASEMTDGAPPEKLTVENALQKFLSVSFNGVGIAADTVVVLNGRILGKPSSEDEAVEFLQMLSDNVHEVVTGYVIGTNGRPIVRDCEKTSVKFTELGQFEIEYMLRSENLMDKAGAYAVQGAAGMFVEWIHGDYTNVVGLPVPSIYRHLKEKFGILPKKWRGQAWV